MTMSAPVDPEGPVELPSSARIVARAIAAVIAFACLALAWRYTPLAELLSPARVIEWAGRAAAAPWTPALVLAAYTPACFVLFPRPLITLFAVAALGPARGLTCAFLGILIAALASFLVGRRLGPGYVRRIAGRRLTKLRVLLQRRGMLAVLAVRVVPVAPFVVVNLAAGALHVRLFDFAAGSAIGILPGTLVASVFGEQLITALAAPERLDWRVIGAATALLLAAAWIMQRWLRAAVGAVGRRRAAQEGTT